jgi:DNA-binding CsgD family transcriptional regulator
MANELLAQEWLKRWGKGKIQAFQDAFACAFGISLCLVTLEGEPLTVWSNSSLFCHYMMQNNRVRCLQERDHVLRQTIETGKTNLAKCYSGVKFFFHPVVYRNNIVCLLYGGGFHYDAGGLGASRSIDGNIPVLTKKKVDNMLTLLAETINLTNQEDAVSLPSGDRTAQDIPLLQQKLSTREIQIALLINSGLANKEIANQLFISEKTVKTHVSNILAKMGLKDRMQLMVFCRQHHID